MRPDDYIVVNHTRIRVAADGTMSGETEQITKGAASAGARAIAAHIQDDGAELAAQKVLRASGNPGRGEFEVPSLSDFREPYAVKGRFVLDQRLDLRAATQPIPQGMAFMRRPGEFLFAEENERRSSFRCLAGRQIEQIELTFTEGLPLPVELNSRTIETRLFTYTTSYKLQNRTFTIRREFVASTALLFTKPQPEATSAKPAKRADNQGGPAKTTRSVAN